LFFRFFAETDKALTSPYADNQQRNAIIFIYFTVYLTILFHVALSNAKDFMFYVIKDKTGNINRALQGTVQNS